ncbi:MAG: hypothetical protein LBM07_08825, partial [Culturomica sp.]|nr:hypothetical protein [Culturomica sp.]
VWYVSEAGAAEWTLIPNEVGAELSSYQQSATVSGASIAVKFKRKAVCSLGEAETTVSTTIPNLKISFSPTSAKLNACVRTTVTASIPYAASTPTFTWTTETGIKTGKTYTPVYGDFTSGTSTNGNRTIKVQSLVSGCRDSTNLSISISLLPANFTQNFTFIDPRDSKVYPILKIGTQCWMTKNMNVGTLVTGSNYSTHSTSGIQKLCYSNSESNCTTYGGLYNWAEAVNGEKVGTGAATTSTAKNIKYAVDGSGYVQGICPDGWHVPSDGEFKTLEMQLGMTESQAGGTDWRGSDQGRQLKSTDLWTAYASTSGTNSSGWSGLPSGYRHTSGGAFNTVGTNGYWWSSSQSSSSSAWRWRLDYNEARVSRATVDKSNGFSVRCLLN